MSIMQQADAVRTADRPIRQVVELTGAKAVLDMVENGSDAERQVRISGIDGYGKERTANIPFQQHFRGEAAVLADQVERTGEVRLKGDIQMGTLDFRASSAESGDATLDERHASFDLKRVLSHGLGMLKGRSDDAIESAAILAHSTRGGHGI